MQDSLKQQVLNAFLLVLRPITRILLRYGIGYREFVEVAKTAYVDVASSDYGLRGRPTNISRVAVMTGLTRKEVKRLRDKIESGDMSITVKTTPLTDVLHHWHAEAEYTDGAGNAAKLPFAGNKGSFSKLVKDFGGDVPAGAMRTELKRVGVVKEDNDGNLIAKSRVLRPDVDHDKLITTLVHGAYTVLSNIAHNTDPENIDTKWASRIAHTTKLKKSDTGQLRRIARDRISEFAEAVDDLFIAYEALHSDDGLEQGDPVAVSVFYFEEQDTSAKYEW